MGSRELADEDPCAVHIAQGLNANDSSLITSTTRRAEKRRTESSQGASWLGKRQRPAHEACSEPLPEVQDNEDQENAQREASSWSPLSGLLPSSLVQIVSQFAACQGLHLGTSTSPAKQAAAVEGGSNCSLQPTQQPLQQHPTPAATVATPSGHCLLQHQQQQQQYAIALADAQVQQQQQQAATSAGQPSTGQQQEASSSLEPPCTADLVCGSTVNSVSAPAGTAGTSCISPGGGDSGAQEVTGALHPHPAPGACGAGDMTDEEEDEDEDDGLDPLVFISRLPPLGHCVSAQRSTLLPRKTRGCKQKTLVLDLDETLVHSTLDVSQSAGADFQFPVFFNGAEHQVYVRQRPHMAAFLEAVAAHYEVVVFTASQKVYAEKLLNILDPKRSLIRHRIYRDSCVVVDGAYLKDLSVLGRDLATTAIVDNSPQAFGFQLDNGIPIESWYEDQGDTELLRLLPFLEQLRDAPDVRPLIQARFGMRAKVDAVRAALATALISHHLPMGMAPPVPLLPALPQAQAQQA